MRFTLLKNIFFAMILACSSHLGEAAVFSAGHPSLGPDSVTIDTITGYAWLDLTLTINLSINDINFELTKGGYMKDSGMQHGMKSMSF